MQLKLKNVRLSFPQLFRPKAVQPGQEPKYSASFLLNKQDGAAQIDAIKKAMRQTAEEQWAGKVPKGVKICLHDGEEKEYDGYGPEIMFVNASSNQRPTVVDRDLTPLTQDDGKPYAGCYVNAVIRFWAQDNEFGKRINAQIRGVQFYRDGEAFGDKPFNAAEEFDKEEPANNAYTPITDEDEIPF